MPANVKLARLRKRRPCRLADLLTIRKSPSRSSGGNGPIAMGSDTSWRSSLTCSISTIAGKNSRMSSPLGMAVDVLRKRGRSPPVTRGELLAQLIQQDRIVQSCPLPFTKLLGPAPVRALSPWWLCLPPLRLAVTSCELGFDEKRRARDRGSFRAAGSSALAMWSVVRPLKSPSSMCRAVANSAEAPDRQSKCWKGKQRPRDRPRPDSLCLCLCSIPETDQGAPSVRRDRQPKRRAPVKGPKRDGWRSASAVVNSQT